MRKNHLGIWSATAVIVIGGMYVATLGAGVAVHGLATPIVDPILAIMEILTPHGISFLVWRCCSLPPCSKVAASPDVRDMAC